MHFCMIIAYNTIKSTQPLNDEFLEYDSLLKNQVV